MNKRFISISCVVIILVALLWQTVLGVTQKDLKGVVGLSINIGGVWFDLEDYNKDIQEYNNFVGTNLNDIEKGTDVNFSVGYGLTESILIRAGVGYFNPEESFGNMTQLIGLNEWNLKVKREINIIPITVDAFYLLRPLSSDKISTFIGGGLGYYFAESRYTYSQSLGSFFSNKIKEKYKGEISGFHLAGKIEYAISSHLAIGFEPRYRFVKIKKMKKSQGEIDDKVFKNEPLSYDLSGPGIRLNLIYFF